MSRENARFWTSGRSLAPNRQSSDQIGGSLSRIRQRPRGTHGNHENVNKSKGPDDGPGLLSIGGYLGAPGGCSPDGSLVLFRLLLRRCQAFEALQKLLFGHALD